MSTKPLFFELTQSKYRKSAKNFSPEIKIDKKKKN